MQQNIMRLASSRVYDGTMRYFDNPNNRGFLRLSSNLRKLLYMISLSHRAIKFNEPIYYISFR